MNTPAVVVLLSALSMTVGCATRQKSKPDPSTLVPISRQTLDQLQPPVSLPEPTTQPSGNPSGQALQLYAQGRDALVSNQKQIAVEKFTAATEVDPSSAVIFRDLGYAWFATDNDRSLAAFQRAAALDPQDAEFHSQIGRLLAIKNKPDEAIHQLRLARLTTGYRDSETDAAVADMLLGRLLISRGYTTAAVDCFERILPVIERRSIELRRWPELVELAARPTEVRLLIADLSVSIDRFDRAIAIYEQIQATDPARAPGIELRIIQARARQGDMNVAASQMLALVDRFDASRFSVQSYIDIFADHGGDEAALTGVRKITADAKPASSIDLTARRVLEARLLRRLGRPADAVGVLDQSTFLATLPAVRELVLAYRDVGRLSDLQIKLLTMMIEQPRNWSAIQRGWVMLTQQMQPKPVSLGEIQAIPIPAQLEVARLFVSARLAQDDGQTQISRQLLTRASTMNAALVRQWATDQMLQVVPDVDVASERDLACFIDEFSDDPHYLGVSIEHLVKNGLTTTITTALQAAVQRRPSNVAALVQLVVMLNASDRKPEALRLIEQSATAITSSPELYQLAILAQGLDELEFAERLLRQSHAADPNHASTCNDLGYVLADSGREMDFAESLLWKAVGLQPDNAAYLDSLGWVLYKRGKFSDANVYLTHALSVSEPPDPVVLDHAADTAYRLNDPARAAQHWNRAVDQIKQQGTGDPQLRLRIEQKLRQSATSQPVDVAPLEPATKPSTLPAILVR